MRDPDTKEGAIVALGGEGVEHAASAVAAQVAEEKPLGVLAVFVLEDGSLLIKAFGTFADAELAMASVKLGYMATHR